EPSRYAETSAPEDPAERLKDSEAFEAEFTGLISGAINGEREWGAVFTQEQINSYLTEGFVHSRLADTLVPESISDPRATLGPDRMRVAFRYGSGFWSTVVSIDLRLWIPELQPNVVAVQLLGMHAGALPVSSQLLLERVSEAARDHGLEVTWYRH